MTPTLRHRRRTTPDLPMRLIYSQAATGLLMDAGFEPQQVLTERFGPTGA